MKLSQIYNGYKTLEGTKMKVFLIVVMMLQMLGIEGFSSYCSTNQTIFIPKGHAATFVFMTGRNWNHAFFIKQSSSRHLLRIRSGDFSPDSITVDFFDTALENRTNVNGTFTAQYQYNITIQIRHVELEDNGTYETNVMFTGDRHCWILFVIDIKQYPVGAIVENEAVKISAQPAASLMVRPVVNATMLWLLDGWPINLTQQFLVQDGSLWTAKLPRNLNGKNVTYRALQDNGQMVEVNITLKVIYGPDWPLILESDKNYYTINNGDKMPDISCQAYCNPPCAISWGQHSTDHVLRLDQVSASSSGEYTCTATNDNGTTRVVARSIFINVLDNTAQIAAFVVLATVQTLTTAFLGIVCICYCIRSGKVPCKQSLNSSSIISKPLSKSRRSLKKIELFDLNYLRGAENKFFKGKETNKNQYPPNSNENHGVGLQGYEDLDLGSSITNHYSSPTTAAGQDVPRMEVYENTRISQSD